ncbi:hypothetical protein D8674_009491 [Pyrus ussuriensis x Pyrus communis]|uniref:Uncharacterized protein n=1 Tax=Pyrus ussuriensis x Pyrus communis TaxID=2448454 RepID=A0A5N5FDI6_9ROSA|nr:hypothetical protein D8674_009491 [Pyrus ussuriensis x Pyrus communis]
MENITGLGQNVINNDEGNDQNVNKHTEQTDEPENISINEAQTEFDKLFAEEIIKLDATVQKHIIGMNTVISEELFDEFKKASSIAEKMYITFREMMTHTMDASNRECLILSQMIKMLNSEVEKLLQEIEINKKNNNALNTEMLKMQTKTNANNLKINNYLKQIASLENKLKETQSRAAEMEPMSNVAEMEVERTPTTSPIIPITEHVQNDVNEGKQYVTKTKEKTRTLFQNTKVEATQVQATKVEETKGELPPKACLKSHLKAKKKETKKITKGDTKSKCPSSKRAYKLLDQYYRQCELDYFWLMPKTRSMATKLVVLRSDLTSLFVNEPIDAKLIDDFFYIKSENEMKEGKEQNLYLSTYIFNDMEIQRSKSDDEYLDQRLKTILEENVDKVGNVFIPMKHYFHFTLIVWDI